MLYSPWALVVAPTRRTSFSARRSWRRLRERRATSTTTCAPGTGLPAGSLTTPLNWRRSLSLYGVAAAGLAPTVVIAMIAMIAGSAGIAGIAMITLIAMIAGRAMVAGGAMIAGGPAKAAMTGWERG